MLGSGTFWMRFWIAVFILAVIWGGLTFAFLLDSVRNLNAISVVTFWVSCAAGFQATLSMKKADPKDPL